ncbi:MAG: hypothetical protein J7J98_03015 [candidate division Zixibacteria bacterium]|nr:hypothetical protein [candidate division Zixibacteria bacterium]
MLYDEERFWGMALEIYTYPFNLVVNRDRVILEIHGSVLLPDDYESLFSVTPAHPFVIPAPYVIPEQSGIQMSCDKALSSTHRCALSKRQLDPRFREGDEMVRTEKPDIRQMWTSAGHNYVT